MLGAAIYAFGLLYFIVPNQLMEGRVTGITILLNYAFDLPIFLTTLLLNLPLFLLGWKVLGSNQIFYTGIGIGLLTFFLWVFERLIAGGWLIPFSTEHDFILASLYAGVTLGAGLGIVFRYGGTTGGVDIVARILARKFGWSMGQIILAVDIIIIGASLLYIPREKYCIPWSPSLFLRGSLILYRKVRMPPKPSPLSAMTPRKLPILSQQRWTGA